MKNLVSDKSDLTGGINASGKIPLCAITVFLLT